MGQDSTGEVRIMSRLDNPLKRSVDWMRKVIPEVTSKSRLRMGGNNGNRSLGRPQGV